MVRAANGLYESALHAAELCERRLVNDPAAADADDWDGRAKHWRLAAERALEVVQNWEAGPPAHAEPAGSATHLADELMPALAETSQRLHAEISLATEPLSDRLRAIAEHVDAAVGRIHRLVSDLRG